MSAFQIRFQRLQHFFCGTALALAGGAAQAADAPAAASPGSEPATVEAIVVNGQQFKGQATPMRLSTAPSADIAAVTVLSGEDIARQTLANNIDIFRSIPGVQVGDFGQVGIAQGVSFRGWPGAQDSSAVAFFLDGVQRNEASGTGANGYLDINPVIPELLDDVTVVKGPFNTRYGGNFALAGSFIATTVDEMPNRLALSAGSYGHYRAFASLGGRSGEATFYTAVRAVIDDGYQQNSDQHQYTTFSKVTSPIGSGEASLSLQTYDLKHGSPGYLDLGLIKAGIISRRDAVSGSDGGEKHQYTLVGNYRQGDADAGFEVAAYGETQSRYRFGTFTPFPQANTRNRRNFYGLNV
ncbi:MAG TPA: TonB-dependent receptor plug domain-containing protein, partial [Phenylobacterium sp.]